MLSAEAYTKASVKDLETSGRVVIRVDTRGCVQLRIQEGLNTLNKDIQWGMS